MSAVLLLGACSSPEGLQETADPPGSLPAADAASVESPVTTRPPQVQETLVLGPVQSTVVSETTSTAEGETTDPSTTTTTEAADEPENTTPPATDSEGNPISALAALTKDRTEEIIALLNEAGGPTENISETVRTVIAFPGGIPTPADSVITELTVGVRVDPIEPTRAVVSEVRVNLSSSESPEAVVRLMRRGLPATGLEADRLSQGELVTGESFTSFSFVPPGGDLQEGVTVLVVEPETKTGTTSSLIQVTDINLTLDTSLLTKFADWAGDPSILPPVGNVSAVSVGLQSGVFIGRPNLLFTGSITRFENNGDFDEAAVLIGDSFETAIQDAESPLIAEIAIFEDETATLILAQVDDDQRRGVSLGISYQTNVDPVVVADPEEPEDSAESESE